MKGRDYFLFLARYHRWANRLLIKFLEPLGDRDYYADHGLFFESIHRTLNHILLVDRLWHARLTGTRFPLPDGLKQELVTERGELVDALDEQAEVWLKFLQDLPEKRFAEVLSYTTTEGVAVSFPINNLLAHAFNHGAHHRGQVTAIMTQLAVPTPEMDIPFYLIDLAEQAQGSEQ